MRLFLWLVWLTLPSAACAHQLDEYLQSTLVVIEPEPTAIRLQMILTPGVSIAEKVLALMDRDADGVISTSEAAAYAELLKHDLMARLDERDLDLKLTTSSIPTVEELRTGAAILQMEFTAAPGALAAGTHMFAWQNRHLADMSVYLINAAKPRSDTLQITQQTRAKNQSSGEITFTFRPPEKPWPGAGRISVILGLLIVIFMGAWALLRDRGVPETKCM